MAAPAQADQTIVTGNATGLSRIVVGSDLSCQAFWGPRQEYFDQTACGTNVAVNGTLYGPQTDPATGHGVPFTPVDPSVPSTDTSTVTTVVNAGATGVQVTQTVAYIAGEDGYSTTVDVHNTTAAPVSIDVAIYADCALQGDDHGFGVVDADLHIPSCTPQQDTPALGSEGLTPLTDAANAQYAVATRDDLLEHTTTQTDLCNCRAASITAFDNAMSIRWKVGTLAAGATATRSFRSTFSPTARVDAPADQGWAPGPQPVIAGTGAAAAGADPTVSVELFSGGSTTGTPVAAAAVALNDGTWSWMPPSLPDRVYTARVSQTDGAGGHQVSSTSTFNLYTSTPPAVSITSPGNGASGVGAQPTLAGTRGTAFGDNPNVAVSLSPLGSSTDLPLAPIAYGTTTWQTAPTQPLADGTYVLRVIQTGEPPTDANRQGAAATTFTVGDPGSTTTTPTTTTAASSNPPPPDQPPPPEPQQSGNVQPTSGSVCAYLPRSKKCTPIVSLTNVPVGTVIDARHGVVELTVADGAGGTQTGDFTGSLFRFDQVREKVRVGRKKHKRVRRLLSTHLTMRGGGNPRKLCPKGSDGRRKGSAAKRRYARYLKAQAHGRFRVIGRRSSGVERGTAWKTTDSCSGTLTEVTDGVVLVTDFAKRRTVVVRAGHRYLATGKRGRRRR